MEEVASQHDKDLLKDLIQRHFEKTGSPLAKSLLGDFDSALANFKKIIPNDYKRMLVETARNEEKGFSHEEAVMEAFKTTTQVA